MPTQTVTSKGQVTIPKEIRDRLKLTPGRRLCAEVNKAGEVVLKPFNDDFRSLRGMLKSRRKTPVSIEEMNEAIAAGWAGE
jgi:antitoxin PrlF